MKARLPHLLLSFFLVPGLFASDFKAGLARVDITPELPIWLSGYAARKEPSRSILMPLAAKALTLEDKKGYRVALVSLDILGLPREVTVEVIKRVGQQYKLERSQILLNCSHTHSGPVVRPNLNLMYDLSPADTDAAERYRVQLTDRIVSVIGAALKNLAPASLSISSGRANFSVNRRQFTANGVRIGVNPEGPTDHEVPVLKIQDSRGKLLGALFGYTCHNTTLGGDNLKINGDYAGFAQAEWEKQHPGSMAMFFQLCGADQNPNPRGTVEHAQKYGKELAMGVDQALHTKMNSLHGTLTSAYQEAKLAFAAHSRKQYEEELAVKDVYRQRRAKMMLASYDEGKPMQSVSLPIQAIRLGKDFTILAIGGETVIDYQIRIKKEYAGQTVMVAGYSNEVMCYIPSRRLIQEGGYEVVDSMIYYGHPGPFPEGVEEEIMQTVHQTMKDVGLQPSSQ